MLDTHRCEEYLAKVRAFADSTGRRAQLEEKLKYLAEYACGNGKDGNHPPDYTRCVLFKDFAPLSFEFRMEVRDSGGVFRYWFQGGLIFHGNHDGFGSGAAPTFAVTLNAEDGWAVHT